MLLDELQGYAVTAYALGKMQAARKPIACFQLTAERN